jgi:hypothetical protein
MRELVLGRLYRERPVLAHRRRWVARRERQLTTHLCYQPGFQLGRRREWQTAQLLDDAVVENEERYGELGKRDRDRGAWISTTGSFVLALAIGAVITLIARHCSSPL